MGALEGGSPMSHVEFKKWLCQLFFYFHVNFQMLSCRMSYLRKGPCHVENIFFLVSIGPMSHVDLKKWPCRPVEFKGQWPLI